MPSLHFVDLSLYSSTIVLALSNFIDTNAILQPSERRGVTATLDYQYKKFVIDRSKRDYPIDRDTLVGFSKLSSS